MCSMIYVLRLIPSSYSRMTPMVDTTGKRLKNGEVLSFYKVNHELL